MTRHFRNIACCMALLCLCFFNAYSQYSFGKVIYERKTNLFKKYKDQEVRNWLKDEHKIKVDVFELYFNDSLSVFRPQESELKDKMSWATNSSTVYQNLKQGKKMGIMDIWGEKLYVEDTLTIRQWKITGSKRNIAGYNCRKAIWQKNDSVRIYAWYAEELMCSVGPETFNGLPGLILGLATEDGGLIYFAQKVEIKDPGVEPLRFKKGKEKIYATEELKSKMQKDFGKRPWVKGMIDSTFELW